MATLTIKNLNKSYGSLKVLNDVNLTVEEGKLVTILGPSGSGKSTLVRAVAGFVHPESGEIYLDNRNITNQRPDLRNTAMVFQNYALWPHMTIYQNIAYGLKLQKKSRDEIEQKVKWVLELVDLPGLEERYPTQLSGGQQQRVALARALVVDPEILLLDEPLSNLDAKIRYRLRFEIKKLQKRLNITTIYITHDQEEALSIADVVILLNEGQILQMDKPEKIYSQPKNSFVAEFLGASNVIAGKVFEDDKGLYTLLGGAKLPVPEGKKVQDEVTIIFRADEVTPAGDECVGNQYIIMKGRNNEQMYLGAKRRYEVETEEGHTLLVDFEEELPIGQDIILSVDRDKLYVY